MAATRLMPEALLALQKKIASVLATKPEYFVTHPAELAVLKGMNTAELKRFAADNGWRTVWRIGGRQIEFYNDVTVRERAVV